MVFQVKMGGRFVAVYQFIRVGMTSECDKYLK